MDTKLITNEAYDYLFKNTDFITFDFVEKFPNSYMDNATNTIFLCIDEDKPLFKITVEKA